MNTLSFFSFIFFSLLKSISSLLRHILIQSSNEITSRAVLHRLCRRRRRLHRLLFRRAFSCTAFAAAANASTACFAADRDEDGDDQNMPAHA